MDCASRQDINNLHKLVLVGNTDKFRKLRGQLDIDLRIVLEEALIIKIGNIGLDLLI